jgi:hypothetical protein
MLTACWWLRSSTSNRTSSRPRRRISPTWHLPCSRYCWSAMTGSRWSDWPRFWCRGHRRLPACSRKQPCGVRTRKAVLESGDWLNAADVAQLAGLRTRNPRAQPNKWKKQGPIFAINHGGVDCFPGYGLDRDAGFRPVKALAKIIETFSEHKDGWGMALLVPLGQQLPGRQAAAGFAGIGSRARDGGGDRRGSGDRSCLTVMTCRDTPDHESDDRFPCPGFKSRTIRRGLLFLLVTVSLMEPFDRKLTHAACWTMPTLTMWCSI